MMSQSVSSQSKWREIFERQQLANAERWLDILVSEGNSAHIVVEEHDNLLRALEVSLQKSETFELAYGLIEQLFPIVFGYGDWDRWIIYLQEAIELSKELNRRSEEANLLSHKGNIMALKGDYQQAHLLYNQSIQIFERLEDRANYASALAKQATVYDLQGNPKEGLAMLEKASEVSHALGDKRALIQINLSLSSAYHKSRKWLSGVSAAQLAYELAKNLGDSQLENLALLNMVANYTELGNWGEVNDISPKIEESLVASGDLSKLSQFKNNMGIAAFNQGKYYVAEKAWQDALQINMQISQSVELARNLNNLGMVYTKLGEIDTAEDMLKKAAVIFEEKNIMFDWANTLDNLADVYESRGDLTEVRRVLTLALSLLSDDSLEPHVQGLVSIINGRLASISK
ncbi:MAG: tetratricopeptide repeat protein [Anaerolineae bacterium]|nr:tetratricopeptide repeat protein [Anaerolineae bacterium]